MLLLTRVRIRTAISACPFFQIAKVLKSDQFQDINFNNEPIYQYMPDSEERTALETALKCVDSKCEEIPIVIDGKEYISNEERYQQMPHRYAKKIAKFYHADPKLIQKATRAAVRAQKKWDRSKISYRIEMWERAANLMATKYRADLVAATMLGQAKTLQQAEADTAKLVDFIRLNAQFLKQAANFQPPGVNANDSKSYVHMRGLEGFVAAISPFNYTCIAGNLAYTPTLMGNGVVWKPADGSMLSNWRVFNVMREAGVPDGVVNFVPAFGPTFGEIVTYSTNLAGINFTGSVPVFNKLWKSVGNTIDFYKNFPRLVGECGGKNFHFVHESADVDVVVAATIRAAFEYGGQKCSSCSRLYVPESLWESKIREPLVTETNKLIVGDVCDYQVFYSALINQKQFLSVVRYLDYAKRSCPKCKIIAGGFGSSLKGYFVQPTIVVVTDPTDQLFKEEIFGPLLSVYVYKADELEKTMDLIANTPRFALAGSVFGKDEQFLKDAVDTFRLTTGNFFINDKCTASKVGQQPFGGSRMSGTNDKAGGPHYILRWTSLQSIKETYAPDKDIYYPHMGVC